MASPGVTVAKDMREFSYTGTWNIVVCREIFSLWNNSHLWVADYLKYILIWNWPEHSLGCRAEGSLIGSGEKIASLLHCSAFHYCNQDLSQSTYREERLTLLMVVVVPAHGSGQGSTPWRMCVAEHKCLIHGQKVKENEEGDKAPPPAVRFQQLPTAVIWRPSL